MDGRNWVKDRMRRVRCRARREEKIGREDRNLWRDHL